MKHLATALIASAALSLGLIQTVMAADMPAKVRPAPLPIAAPTWSGFYIGGTVGGGVASLPIHDQDCFDCSWPSEDSKEAGFVGGGHIGYNWQLGPSFLLGVETDFNWGSFKAKETTCFGPCLAGDVRRSISSEIDYFGTIRGRAGLISGNALAYVTGGAAYARIKSSFAATAVSTNTLFAVASDDSTHWGIAVGAGVEYMAGTNWVFRAEYLYLDFLKKSIDIVEPGDGPTGLRLGKSADMHIARVGLSYKFGGAPY